MNPGGDLDGIPSGALDRVTDPQLCDPDNWNLTVSEASPCLPPYSNGCGQIGALGAGCSPISVQSRTWGRIKAGYR